MKIYTRNSSTDLFKNLTLILNKEMKKGRLREGRGRKSKIVYTCMSKKGRKRRADRKIKRKGERGGIFFFNAKAVLMVITLSLSAFG